MAPMEILIIGCSIAGPTLASFLLSSDLPPSEKPRITIIERSTAMRMEGQNIDIRGAGLAVVRKLGLEGVIRASTTGEEGVRIVDGKDQICAEFKADRSGRLQTPTSDIEIMRGRLADICFKRSQSLSDEVQRSGGVGVEYIFGDQIDELEQDGRKVHVRFANSGARRSFDLVVGADGLQSRTRSMAWGKDGEEERIKKIGMYCAFFSMSKANTDSEWRRWYHAPGRRGIMLRPDEQRKKTTALMTIITDKDQGLMNAAVKGPDGVDAQKKLVYEYFQGCEWETQRVLREMMDSDDFYYTMVAQVKMNGWSKGRVVLLGDAGYCASPISGMGTTLALTGAYNLAGSLLRYPNDHSAALLNYDDQMRPIVERAQKLAPGMPYAINPETAWGIWIMHSLLGLICWSGIMPLVFKFAGPPANKVFVEEYGFPELAEWTD